MPTAQASATKQDAMNAMAFLVGDRLLFTTTGAGSSTTAVSTDLTGYPNDYFNTGPQWWLLAEDGTYAGQWREVSDFVQSTGTVTVSRAFGGTIASGVVCSLWRYRPDSYTLAVNDARRTIAHACYKVETDYVLVTDTTRRTCGVPRGMTDVWRVSLEAEGSLLFKDLFDRGDSTTTAGSDYTATTGTWGIISERLYSVTDADGDILTRDPDVQDGTLQAILRGTLNSASVYRTPALVFRLFEDYAGAIDTNNYLLVRLLNGSVDLRKVDGGTESSLTTASLTTSDGVDYVVRVMFVGGAIRVWVDDVELITYQLTGLNLKYLSGVRVGVRWDKGGSPATAARVDDWRVHRVVPFEQHHDWAVTPDKAIVEFGAIGEHANLYADRWLRFEGGALLSALAADTTMGTLASYTTAAMEITTTSPEWQILVEAGVASLMTHALSLAYGGLAENRQEWRALRNEALARLTAVARQYRMPRPHKPVQYPY